MTASELMSELAGDPVYREQSRRRAAQLEANWAEYLQEESPVRSDLERAGCKVHSVWDFVNRPDDYPEAIPTLRRHLLRPHAPCVLEGIVRALTLPRLRGVISDELWQVFAARGGASYEQVRITLLAAFAVVGTTADRPRLKDIAKSQSVSEDERSVARSALRRLTPADK